MRFTQQEKRDITTKLKWLRVNYKRKMEISEETFMELYATFDRDKNKEIDKLIKDLGWFTKKHFMEYFNNVFITALNNSLEQYIFC